MKRTIGLIAICAAITACGGGEGGGSPAADQTAQLPAQPVVEGPVVTGTAPAVQTPAQPADTQSAPQPSSSTAPRSDTPAPGGPAEPAEPPAALGPACTPTAADPTQLAAVRTKLPHWFSSNIAGKRIVLIGDSTTSQMGPETVGGRPGLFDAFLATYVTPDGAPLHGVSVSMLAANGDTLANYAAHDSDFSSGTGLYATTQTAASLFVFSYGINDVRQGAAGVDEIVANLRKVVNTIRSAKPGVDIVLRMPNSLLTTDTGQHYVQPNTEAQRYSNILRDAYRSLANEWPDVAVYDAQARLFGELSLPAHQCMVDQLHPSDAGYALVFQQIVELLAP